MLGVLGNSFRLFLRQFLASCKSRITRVPRSQRSRRSRCLEAVRAVLEPLEPRLLLSTVDWNNSSGGDWDTGGNWSPTGVPGASNDVVIDLAGTYTVTHSTSATDLINSLTLDKSLTISAGTLKIADGLTIGSGTTLTVDSGATLEFNGSQTINGGGSIVLEAGSQLQIDASDTLTIASGTTISGAGYIGGSGSLINHGTVDANVSGQELSLVTPMTNYGTLEATGGGYLNMGTSITLNSGGNVTIDSGSSGYIGVGSSSTWTNAGTINVDDGTLNIINADTNIFAFNNSGTIDVSGSGGYLGIYSNGNYAATTITNTSSGYINATGGTTNIGFNSSVSPDTGFNAFVNYGTIHAEGGAISIAGYVTDGGSYTSGFTGPIIDNEGTITAGSGGSVTLTVLQSSYGNGFLNNGTINVDDGTLKIVNSCSDNFAFNNSGAIDVSGSGGYLGIYSDGSYSETTITNTSSGYVNATGGTVNIGSAASGNTSSGYTMFVNYGTINAENATISIGGNVSGTADILSYLSGLSSPIIYNDGTIKSEDGGSITMTVGSSHYGRGLVNQGTINADGGYIELNASGCYTVNSGSGIIESSSSGRVNIFSSTSYSQPASGYTTFTNFGTISADDGTVSISGYVTSAAYGIDNASDATMTSSSGGSILIQTVGGSSGVIFNGGTIDADGGYVKLNATNVSGSHIANVGTLETSGSAGVICLQGDASNTGTIDAAGGYFGFLSSSSYFTNSGTIDVSAGGYVGFDGYRVTTITNDGTIDVSGGTLSSFGGPSDDSSFTNASGATIMITGGNVYLDGTSGADGQAIINNGTITVNGGTFTAGGYGYSGGGYVTGFSNTGTLHLESGTVTLAGYTPSTEPTLSTWTNSGTFNLAGGTLNIGGVFAYSNLGLSGWSNSGTTVNLTGQLTDTGHTLTLAPTTTGSWNVENGEIIGGTITTSSGAVIALPASATGTFDGVTLNTGSAGLALDNNTSTLSIEDGLTLDSGTTVTVDHGSIIEFDHNSGTGQTLGGTGTIDLGGTIGMSFTNGYIVDHDSSGDLTFGSGITISGAGYIKAYSSSGFTLVNEGTIDAATSTELLDFGANGLSWSSTGTIEDNGGIMDLGGVFSTTGLGTLSYSSGQMELSGVLTNTGHTLTLSTTTTGSTLRMQTGSDIVGGTIDEDAGTELSVGTSQTGELDGVDVTGTGNIDVTQNYADLKLKDNLTFAGTLTVGSCASTLELANTETISGPTITGMQYLTGLSAENPLNSSIYHRTALLQLDSGATATIASGTAVGGGFYAPAISGTATLINDGTITANAGYLMALTGNYILGGSTGLTVDNDGAVVSNGGGSYSTQPPGSVVLPDSGVHPQAAIGQAIAISPTEINLGWYGMPTGDTYSIQESTNGTDYTTISSSLPTSNYMILEGLEPDTNYYFRIQATNTSTGATFTFNTGAVTTLPVVNSDVPGEVSTNDRSGWYLVNNVTYVSTGDPVSSSSYDTQPIYAGSPQGALLIALDNLLQTQSSSYMGVLEPVAVEDGGYTVGNITYDCPYPGVPSPPGTYHANPTPVLGSPPCPCTNGTPGLENNNSLSGGPLNTTYAPVTYYNGAVDYSATDLSSNGFSQDMDQTRSWAGLSQANPDPINGLGWDVTAAPSLTEYGAESALVVSQASDAQVLFTQNSAGDYVSSDYRQDTLTYNSGTDIYTYTDTTGNQTEFYGFGSSTAADLQGKVKEFISSAGYQINYSYTSGNMTQMEEIDSAGDKQIYNYSYTSESTAQGTFDMINEVQYEVQVGTEPATLVRQVAYTYYGSGASFGNAGDLETATVEDASDNVIEEYYYRYYTPGDITSGDSTIGYVGGLQYVFDPQNFTALCAANGLSSTPTTAELAALTPAEAAPYADHYYQYNSQRQVTLEHVAGEFNLTSGVDSQGTYTYSYSMNSDPSSVYSFNSSTGIIAENNNQWMFKTVVTNPSGNQNVVYTNFAGNVLLNMFVDTSDPGNPSSEGNITITAYQYNDQGQLTETINPSAINLSASILSGATTASGIESKIESYADLGLSEGLVQTSSGSIDTTTYYTSTSTTGIPASGSYTSVASSTYAGGVTGYIEADYVQEGSSGTPIEQDSYTYYTYTSENGTTIDPTATYTQYQNTGGGGAETTSYSYVYHSADGKMFSQAVSAPVVSSGENGSDSADVTTTVYDVYGRPVWTKDASGFIAYTAYDPVTGAVIQSVQDVKTSDVSSLTGYDENGSPVLPSGWSTPSGGGLNLSTTYEVDSLGRTIQATDPNGNVTDYIYEDGAIFTLPGVTESLTDDSGTATTTGPITMVRNGIPDTYTVGDATYGGTYDEDLSFSGTLTVTDGVIQMPGFNTNGTFKLVGDGTTDDPQFTLQTLSRTLYNNNGQEIESDAYFDIENTTYLDQADNSPYAGTVNDNFYATLFSYDTSSRQYQTVDPTGTITDNVYDSLDQLVSTWEGTDDAVSGDTGTPSYFDGANAGTDNNMVEVAGYQYDNGGVGDGDLTETIQYPDGNTTGTQQVTLLSYDFRDRLVAIESGLTLNDSGDVAISSSDSYPLITVQTLDNLGDATATLTFNGADTTIADAITASASAAPDAELTGLVGYSTSDYDSQDRVYEQQTYSVDPDTGTISSTALTTYTFYDARGNVIETVSSTGLTTKYAYNGVGENVMQYTVDAAADPAPTSSGAYEAAGNLTYDIVLEQVAYGYDGDGNLIETVDAQRFNTDPTSGSSAEGALFTDSVNSDGSLSVTPASGSYLKSRIYYTASYYDAADRDVADVNVGDNGGSTWSRPSSIPTDSATVLVTITAYNLAGWVLDSTDPRGIDTRNYYDNLGRVTTTVNAYDSSVNSGNPTPDQNQTTEYTYNGDNQQTSMTAVGYAETDDYPAMSNQTTAYVYGVSTSTITANNLLEKIEYPDLSTGAASSSASYDVSYAYNALGQVLTMTDQNGTTHTYTYDTLGRQISDTVTTLGSYEGPDDTTISVDGGVRRINTAYNDQGLPYLITSYSNTSGTSVVNQIEDVYNGLGQLTGQYQNVSGAVDTESTPEVQYGYSSISSGSLLTSMTYPNGREIYYNYNSGLDGDIGRLSSISDESGGEDILESYQYLGLNTIVEMDHPQTGINLTYISTDDSTGDGGDQYVGLDRFGRVVDQNWYNTGTDSSTDEFTYSYDQDGNVVTEDNVGYMNYSDGSDNYNQTFTYDDLNRLTSDTYGSGSYVDYNLDGQGNWTSENVSGTTTTRSNNAQNQITGIEGASYYLTYDHDGNMTEDQNGNKYFYNAWNELVEVKNSSDTEIAGYTYNGLGQEVTATYPGSSLTKNFYYSTNNQVIEERDNGTSSTDVQYQYVWSAGYVDAMVLRDTYSDGSLVADDRIYTQYDANYNVTALVNYNGSSVLERFTYDPYGNVTVRDATTWESTTDSQNWSYMHQGEAYDSTIGLYYGNARWYSPELGRWTSQDPAGYINGANRYQYELSNPATGLDPKGTDDTLEILLFLWEELNQVHDAQTAAHLLSPPDGPPIPPPCPPPGECAKLEQLAAEANASYQNSKTDLQDDIFNSRNAYSTQTQRDAASEAISSDIAAMSSAKRLIDAINGQLANCGCNSDGGSSSNSGYGPDGGYDAQDPYKDIR